MRPILFQAPEFPQRQSPNRADSHASEYGFVCMAKIEDLIAQIPDERLRKGIAAEVKALKKTKKFGLVFEEHLPETVRLPRLPVSWTSCRCPTPSMCKPTTPSTTSPCANTLTALDKLFMCEPANRLLQRREPLFPKMEMDEHREQRKKIAARIAELEKQLLDYAKKIAERKSGS